MFILVHDEVIIKLPQKRSGESSSEFLLSSSKPKQSCQWFYWLRVKKCFCFHSVTEHSKMSVLSFYHLIILVLVYTQEIQEIVQDIGFQAKHVSLIRSDMNLVKYSTIFSTNWDDIKSTYYYNIWLNHKEYFKRFKYQIFIS